MLRRKSHSALFGFFGLVFAAAIPFTILGFVVETPENTPMHLPASAVIFILPALVASLLVRRKGLTWLWGKLKDSRYKSHSKWYLISLVCMPVVAAITYVLLLYLGVGLGSIEMSLVGLLILCVVYGISALFEEVGWMGYAFDPLEKRLGTVYASLFLGVAWALFHIVPWVQVHGVFWAIGWALFSVMVRIPLTVLYKQTGRTLPAVIIAHASINVVVSLWPNFTGNMLAPYVFAGLTLLLAVGMIGINKAVVEKPTQT